MSYTSQRTIMERRRKTATLDLTLETPGLAAEAGLLSASSPPLDITSLIGDTVYCLPDRQDYVFLETCWEKWTCL